ncbi:EamA family transporter [Candidatus Bipolaricaulota bacterium]|nr:EamA family transporter [Candidatus Bipolaricaulota bacterium]
MNAGPGSRKALLQGMIALALWGTTVAVGRDFLEATGPILGSSIVFLASGLALLVAMTIRSRGIGWRHQISTRHLWVCGPFFVVYLCLFYLALGLAESRDQAVIAGLVNYLWPTWVVVLSIPFQKTRPRALPFAVGIVLGIGGVLLATSVLVLVGTGNSGWSASGFVGVVAEAWLPLMLAGVGSVAWGVYSNLAKRVPQEATSAAIGMLLAAAGLTLLVPGLLQVHEVHWSLRVVLELIYAAIFPTAVAYSLWDRAMRDGDVAILGSISNLLPVASVALAAALLGVPLHWRLVGGAVAVAAGSLACRRSLRKRSASRKVVGAQAGGSDVRDSRQR